MPMRFRDSSYSDDTHIVLVFVWIVFWFAIWYLLDMLINEVWLVKKSTELNEIQIKKIILYIALTLICGIILLYTGEVQKF